MNREVHVRFWERTEVKLLRATRQSRPNCAAGAMSGLPLDADSRNALDRLSDGVSVAAIIELRIDSPKNRNSNQCTNNSLHAKPSAEIGGSSPFSRLYTPEPAADIAWDSVSCQKQASHA